MKVSLYSSTGKKKKKKITLPEIFQEPYRPDLIRKAWKIARANARQPYGSSALAGKRHVAHTLGKGSGVARVRRLADRTGSFSPGTVGGRKAHPPKAEKLWAKKMNKKERRKALRSALAATADKDLVFARGHKFSCKELPLVVENRFENLNKTKKVVETLENLGVGVDLKRSKLGKRIRAGKGTLRGRRYRIPKSLLLVCTKRCLGAENMPGVDLATANTLSVDKLAPGGVAGRLTLFTKEALKKVGEVYGSL